MRLSFGFGTSTQEVEVPEKNLMGELHANAVPTGLTGEAEVRRALAEPIGTPRLGEIVKPGEKIAIVTSDITRPMPTYKVMPALLDELYAAGVRREDITLVFALGSHRHHTDEERRRLAGERAFSEIACVDCEPTDCVHMGVTKAGTPWILPGWWRRRTGGSAWETLSTTILPGIPAVPRPLCPGFPPGTPSRATTP